MLVRFRDTLYICVSYVPALEVPAIGMRDHSMKTEFSTNGIRLRLDLIYTYLFLLIIALSYLEYYHLATKGQRRELMIDPVAFAGLCRGQRSSFEVPIYQDWILVVIFGTLDKHASKPCWSTWGPLWNVKGCADPIKWAKQYRNRAADANTSYTSRDLRCTKNFSSFPTSLLL
jgi:hypothetical protein